MASPTHVNKIADIFPPLVGWYCADKNHYSYLTFNGLNLSFNSRHFPLQARIRLYDKESHLISEFYTEEITQHDTKIVCLNDHLNSEVMDGLFECSVFSLTEEGLEHSYYNEVWGTVVALDGTMEVNYPLLITRGASPTQVDASTLYYPGIALDAYVSPSLVVMNHHDFSVDYEVTLVSQDGTRISKNRLGIKPKHLSNMPLSEIFPDAAETLKDGPGLLIFHFDYKLNAYVQTRHARTGFLYGMDHVGILFAVDKIKSEPDDKHLHAINQNRGTDQVLCYCSAVSKSELQKYKDIGEDVVTAMKSTQAGKVCLGCIPDIEGLFGQKVPAGVFCKKKCKEENPMAL